MSGRVPVTFAPAGVSVWVEPGETVLVAARRAGIVIPAPCGGRGVCGSCGVRVLSGELEPADAAERAGLSRAPQGVRLACRARIAGPVEVRPVVAHAAPQVSGEKRRAGVLVAGVDLGTTTVAAALCDARTGLELGRGSAPNRQQSYGADVLSRLAAAMGGDAGELANAAARSVAEALAAAAGVAGVSLEAVERVTIAGNSAMAALFAGVDVHRLGVAPFEAPATGGVIETPELLSAVLGPEVVVSLVPPVVSFVGGDALAASVAAGLYDSAAPALLVDLGTNAEIVLAGCGPLVTASAAAGPAFEGGGLSCGGPAVPGAVERVSVGGDGSVALSVMGDVPGQWLSGAGVVSAVAALRAAGHLDATGLLRQDGPLADRFEVDDAGVLGVALGDEGSLRLTQLDVRAVQLAKAAVRVGIETVLAQSCVLPEQLAAVYVAGAFGGALDLDDLVSLGILPVKTAAAARQIGNASLDGALVLALDPGIEAQASELAAGARGIDLAAQPGFAAALVEATSLQEYGA